ncbi:spheroidene monooxygenase [Palleronia aestuarii]|uniref:Spheroidene monooxygenase n=1 Tax=Palleronia aestuarii TaxID=568105 RepID=A0A2W7QAY1_9RHOB|nr:spheroidene monooxygenase [Palleronia aestuarii]PZX18909.1 spheroidene monooxygenase [Palleronia aestuarii]
MSILRDTRSGKSTGVSAIQTVTLSVFRFDTIRARVWAFAQMGFARLDFHLMKRCSFWKLCGSGGERFATADPRIYAILAVWDDAETARRTTEDARIYRRWRRHAVEDYTLFLQATQVRGHWSGRTPFRVTDKAAPGPLAALTRATIRPSRLAKFWRRAPEISDVIGTNPDVLFKIGIGEVPVLHQITFSVWPDAGSMARFARRDGPHARAVRAVRAGDWFREELYARFRVTGSRGTWAGSDPLSQYRDAV